MQLILQNVIAFLPYAYHTRIAIPEGKVAPWLERWRHVTRTKRSRSWQYAYRAQYIENSWRVEMLFSNNHSLLD